MKKTLFALFASFLVLGMIACSDKRDLSDTVWKSEIPLTIGEDGQSINIEATMQFNSDTDGVMIMTFLGESTEDTFLYSCDSKGNGIMRVPDVNGSYQSNEFAVIGDELTFREDGEKIVFKKQK